MRPTCSSLRIPWSRIGSGIRDYINGIMEYLGEAELEKSRSYQALDRVIFTYVCTPYGQVGGAYGSYWTASAAHQAALEAGRTATQVARAAGYVGLTIMVAHIGYCSIPRSDPTPGPTPDPTQTPDLTPTPDPRPHKPGNYCAGTWTYGQMAPGGATAWYYKSW
ncbi:hypothetical protein [Candidatus Poriferisocius sp.]|uniref:hypothetical protein n=1 Tax=Candidatus Poriferisocius sp. TaxID=3101276 RepID=UPI003B5298D0